MRQVRTSVINYIINSITEEFGGVGWESDASVDFGVGRKIRIRAKIHHEDDHRRWEEDYDHGYDDDEEPEEEAPWQEYDRLTVMVYHGEEKIFERSSSIALPPDSHNERSHDGQQKHQYNLDIRKRLFAALRTWKSKPVELTAPKTPIAPVKPNAPSPAPKGKRPFKKEFLEKFQMQTPASDILVESAKALVEVLNQYGDFKPDPEYHGGRGYFKADIPGKHFKLHGLFEMPPMIVVKFRVALNPKTYEAKVWTMIKNRDDTVISATVQGSDARDLAAKTKKQILELTTKQVERQAREEKEQDAKERAKIVKPKTGPAPPSVTPTKESVRKDAKNIKIKYGVAAGVALAAALLVAFIGAISVSIIIFRKSIARLGRKTRAKLKLAIDSLRRKGWAPGKPLSARDRFFLVQVAAGIPREDAVKMLSAISKMG